MSRNIKQSIVGEEDSCRCSECQALVLLDRGFHFGDAIRTTRSVLHKLAENSSRITNTQRIVQLGNLGRGQVGHSELLLLVGCCLDSLP
jgi:hypothetical protein